MFRLIDALGDEIRTIKLHAEIKVVHLPGNCNVEADKLSRLCSQIQPLLEGDGLPDTTSNLTDLLSEPPEESDSSPFESNYFESELCDPEIDRLSDSISLCSLLCPTVDTVPPDAVEPEVRLPIDVMKESPGTILEFVCQLPDLAGIDSVCRVTPSPCDSWVEHISVDSYDVATICFKASIMRFILKS